MSPLIVIFFVVILIFSVIIHEISHGYVALWLGDHTARLAGRLTLNPLKHIDPIGSIIVPLVLILTGGPVFGWARPVPYNPYNLKDPKRGAGLIAIAGPISNLALALVFAIFVRIMVGANILLSAPLFLFFNLIIQVNIALAIFNLIPIPPLDGSGILFSLLPARFERVMLFLRQYGFVILLVLIFSGLSFLGPVILGIQKLMIGSVAWGMIM
ncbi:MAG: site-2 protease family protein [Candidatus Harrisonbacteria bacterium CG10_big_fil_rev_8_21_14_0_10_45_28]|uniref:Site-2 protease family protein n=1 Tax=Candidatus Harrisonbacteria bacterium CG10_big_fil_rev_8_21_14_0_10_45_28 TaxID=1974586 RepID=A0A2H0UMF4_9BACT|nr:MAG: site-2 protease family protein [Candidatus Harrisonbacteria bacterium CG10_big_fil_rev_8_21_14_0_10_45_28]